MRKIEISKQHFYALSVSETLAMLETSMDGLSEEEAIRRNRRFGKNSFTEKNKKTILQLISSNLPTL